MNAMAMAQKSGNRSDLLMNINETFRNKRYKMEKNE